MKIGACTISVFFVASQRPKEAQLVWLGIASIIIFSNMIRLYGICDCTDDDGKGFYLFRYSHKWLNIEIEIENQEQYNNESQIFRGWVVITQSIQNGFCYSTIALGLQNHLLLICVWMYYLFSLNFTRHSVQCAVYMYLVFCQRE